MDLGPLARDSMQARDALCKCFPCKRAVGQRAPCTVLFETEYTELQENEANACLIAAAPEMYEALERFLLAYEGGTAASSVQQQDEDAVFAKAALAKARGEARNKWRLIR